MHTVNIVPIEEKHIPSYRNTVGAVAAEGKYLSCTKAYPLHETIAFVQKCIALHFPAFVAVNENEEVVGWCDIQEKQNATNKTGTLGIGLKAEFRGQGLGRKLLQSALFCARERGFDTVELTAFTDNQRAIHLYQVAGFRSVCLLPKALELAGVKRDLIKMILPLCKYLPSPASAYHFRSALPTDAAAISRIHAQSWKAAYQGMIPQIYLDELTENYWTSTVTNWLKSGRFSGLLALDEQNKPVGSILFGASRENDSPVQGEIVSLYLLPEHWGTGAGGLLLEQAVSRLLCDGFPACYLWVLQQNHRARAFYQKNRFCTEGVTCDCEIAGTHLTDVLYRRMMTE